MKTKEKEEDIKLMKVKIFGTKQEMGKAAAEKAGKILTNTRRKKVTEEDEK